MRIVTLAWLMATAGSVLIQTDTQINPIRRIVNLLQKMQEEVGAEGEKEAEIWKKESCMCQSNEAKLNADITKGDNAVKQLASDAENYGGKKGQLDAEVAQHRRDRDDAKAAVNQANAMRSEESASFQKSDQENSANLNSMKGAIKALKGGKGALLQTPVRRSRLMSAITSVESVGDDDKETVFSFLNAQSASPASEIVGILSQMADTLEKQIGDERKEEADRAKAHSELVSSKNAEIATASLAIEKKVERAGEAGVKSAEAKGASEAQRTELSKNTEFLATLQDSCATKEKEYNERVETRGDELKAIGDAIAVLNDDDALDIFKKSAFIQKDPAFIQTFNPRRRALSLIESAASVSLDRAPVLNLISYMLRVGKADFSKVSTMIDEMGENLKKEQVSDEKHLKECNDNIDNSEDTVKDLKRDVDGAQSEMESHENDMGMQGQSVAEQNDKIKETKKAMEDATEQRKEESAEFKKSSAELTAAKMLLEKAKNRLNKFYNPGMYKPPPQRQLTEEQKLAQSMGQPIPTEAPKFIPGTNIVADPTSFLQINKSKKSGGVIALMDMMLKDVEKQLTEAQHAEEDGQRDYQRVMKIAGESVASAEASKTAAETAKATAEEKKVEAEQSLAGKSDELNQESQALAGFHGECDFLIANFDIRKEARTNEREALQNAKAILSGAKFD